MIKNIILVFIIISIILFSLVLFLFTQRKDISVRVKATQDLLSVENSYVFVNPLKAAVASKESIRVTVFVLSSQGLGVLGKKVVLEPNSALTIKAVSDTTDETGKAVFDVRSDNKGEYYLEAKIADKVLNQKAHLSFY